MTMTQSPWTSSCPSYSKSMNFAKQTSTWRNISIRSVAWSNLTLRPVIVYCISSHDNWFFVLVQFGTLHYKLPPTAFTFSSHFTEKYKSTCADCPTWRLLSQFLFYNYFTLSLLQYYSVQYSETRSDRCCQKHARNYAMRRYYAQIVSVNKRKPNVKQLKDSSRKVNTPFTITRTHNVSWQTHSWRSDGQMDKSLVSTQLRIMTS